jgi:osmotically-inducible protein OsmY
LVPDPRASKVTSVRSTSVQPVGAEFDARKIASTEIEDEAIKKSCKAAVISSGLDKRHIDINARNGVLALKGNVKTVKLREEAQQVAANVPKVQQVLNQTDVQRLDRRGTICS